MSEKNSPTLLDSPDSRSPRTGGGAPPKPKGENRPQLAIDETYVRVYGYWNYLYRAIDRNGALVDVMLSEHRNLAAAKRFFRSAKTVTGVIPNPVTTDGHNPIPRPSGWSSAAARGIGQIATSTIASSRIIVRPDVDRCSASKASYQQDDIAAVTTNSGTSSAPDLACANIFPPLHGAFTMWAGQAIVLGILEAA